jgi:hypothetical protein
MGELPNSLSSASANKRRMPFPLKISGNNDGLATVKDSGRDSLTKG